MITAYHQITWNNARTQCSERCWKVHRSDVHASGGARQPHPSVLQRGSISRLLPLVPEHPLNQETAEKPEVAEDRPNHLHLGAA
jgi:hypothetical protein